jgi:hypothetical protein
VEVIPQVLVTKEVLHVFKADLESQEGKSVFKLELDSNQVAVSIFVVVGLQA